MLHDASICCPFKHMSHVPLVSAGTGEASAGRKTVVGRGCGWQMMAVIDMFDGSWWILMDLDVHGICASAADDDVITWCTWCTGCSWTKVTDGNTEMKQMKYAPLCTFTSAHTRQEQLCHIMRTHTVLILFATNGIPSGWSDVYWDTKTVAVYSWRMIWQLCFIMFSILLLLSHPSSLRSLSLGLDFKYVAILWCQLQATYWVVL